jgi:N-acetylmuramoyl-L-alanine amidase
MLSHEMRAPEELQPPIIASSVWACLTIFQEAEGEPFAGKLAVAEVIRNRTAARYASDGTIASTCLRPFQFSGWNTASMNRLRSCLLRPDDLVYRACLRAWTLALEGSTTVNGALLYYNPTLIPVPPKWATPAFARQVAVVGAHVFFVPL